MRKIKGMMRKIKGEFTQEQRAQVAKHYTVCEALEDKQEMMHEMRRESRFLSDLRMPELADGQAWTVVCWPDQESVELRRFTEVGIGYCLTESEAITDLQDLHALYVSTQIGPALQLLSIMVARDAHSWPSVCPLLASCQVEDGRIRLTELVVSANVSSKDRELLEPVLSEHGLLFRTMTREQLAVPPVVLPELSREETEKAMELPRLYKLACTLGAPVVKE